MLEAGEATLQSRLHTGFLVSAFRYPDRVALSIGQQQWTYAQIEELARRWAAQLIVVTGGQPARIGVLGYKSLTSYVGILASLFAGATYVPLNPNYPVLRTRLIAQQADLNAIIVDERSVSQLPAIFDGRFTSLVILSPTSAIDAVPSVASTVYGEREIGSMKPLSKIPQVAELHSLPPVHFGQHRHAQWSSYHACERFIFSQNKFREISTQSGRHVNAYI